MAIGKVDDLNRRERLAAVKEDFLADKLYTSLSEPQLSDLFLFLETTLQRTESKFPESLIDIAPETSSLIGVIRSFLSDDLLRVLELTPHLSLWSESSGALASVVADSEYLVRTDVIPRTKPYLANGGSSQFAFCVSYPRSGNTMLTNLLDVLIPNSRHSMFWSDGHYISRWARNVITPGDVIAKDHHFCNLQLRNKIIYIVRRYTDVLKSHITFVFNEMRRIPSQYTKEIFDDIPSFISYTRTDFEFGSWEAQVSDICDCCSYNKGIKIVRYEDLIGSERVNTVRGVFEFLERSVPSDAEILGAINSIGQIRDNLRNQNNDWAPLVGASGVPKLVAEAAQSNTADWLSKLSNDDRAMIERIETSAASKALGYGG